jgi:hypothetical protein
MSTWILIVYLTADTWVAHLTFDTKIECEKYAATMQLKGQRAICLPGTIEEKRG